MKTLMTCALAAVGAPAALAGISTLGPFVGDQREPLDIPGTSINADKPIFNGEAHLRSYDGVATVIHYLASDSFGGDVVNPRTGSHILGWTQGPGEFWFDPPVSRFGSYWNNNSGANDATVRFFNSSGTLLGTTTATVPAPGTAWTWNGWQSTEPIGRIEVTGNGVINGFLWFDDLEKSSVPGPGALAAAGVLLGPWARGRARRAHAPCAS